MKYCLLLVVHTDEGMGFDTQDLVQDHLHEAIRAAGDAGIYCRMRTLVQDPLRVRLREILEETAKSPYSMGYDGLRAKLVAVLAEHEDPETV